MKSNNFNYRFNHQISAAELRVIGEDSKQIGVMKFSDALKKANEMGLDLIEIAPMAKPPVAKIMDLGKFKYEEEKKAKKEKRGIKGGDTKEIRFSPFIGEADYKVRLQKIREFLDDKDKVRLVVKFKGRQMGSKEFGYKLLGRVVNEFGDAVGVDMEPKFLGRNLVMVISPRASKKPQTEVQ